MKKFILCSIALFTFLPSIAMAKSMPSGGGVFPVFGQFPDMDTDIKGMRINPGWGHNPTVYGLDLSVAGGSTSKEFIGLQFAGGFNYNTGKTIAVIGQIAGLYNHNSGPTKIYGIQGSVLVNNNGKGKADIYGLQVATVNLGSTNIHGLQVGIYNQAESVRGLQIGVINTTKSLSGVQIGLANYAKNGMLPFFPVFNVGF